MPIVERDVYDDEHEALAEVVSDFLRKEIAPHLADWENEGALPRSAYLAADTQPMDALITALERKGLRVHALYVTSLKDPAATTVVRSLIEIEIPAVIVNATAFSAQRDDGSCLLDEANCPILQVATAGIPQDAWEASERGIPCG